MDISQIPNKIDLNNNRRILDIIYHNYIFIHKYLIFKKIFHIIFSYCFVNYDIFKGSIKLCIQRFQLIFHE